MLREYTFDVRAILEDDMMITDAIGGLSSRQRALLVTLNCLNETQWSKIMGMVTFSAVKDVHGQTQLLLICCLLATYR